MKGEHRFDNSLTANQIEDARFEILSTLAAAFTIRRRKEDTFAGKKILNLEEVDPPQIIELRLDNSTNLTRNLPPGSDTFRWEDEISTHQSTQETVRPLLDDSKTKKEWDQSEHPYVLDKGHKDARVSYARQAVLHPALLYFQYSKIPEILGGDQEIDTEEVDDVPSESLNRRTIVWNWTSEDDNWKSQHTLCVVRQAKASSLI